ncbi:MAG: chemotaxis protein CheW [Bdellovibrionales bacterium]|nr:chemotaxis protein CheW [Bdellovibrionales bacterium]
MQKITTDIFTSFHLDTTEIAITVSNVQEVVNLPSRIIPMPLSPDFLVGVFNLRGMIIPIINLKNLFKYADDKVRDTQKVAIVEISGAKVGLIFDSTSEILRVSHDIVSNFNYVSESSHKIISGAIKLNDGERILQILDAPSLITIENVPQILEQQNIKRIHTSKNKLDQRHKCISFTVNSMKMAFEISKIFEIIRVPEIKQSSIQSPIFEGIITLRGLVVPVVSFSKLLKAPENIKSDMGDKRIIILRMEDELMGMMVDSVECINSYYDEELMSVPLLSKERSGMFKGCLDLPDVGEIFLVEHAEILSNKEILEVTEGHSKIYQAARDNAVLKKINRESYISFRLDHFFGVSIKDIKEIINYSDEIISAPGMPSFVKGMLNLRSNLVTIIDTRSLYKMDNFKENKGVELTTSDAKVLIFEKGSDRFGLIVDSLESILTIDQDKKFQIPSLVTQKIQGQFQKDIKEIVSVELREKESALIILNMDSVTERIRKAA